MSGAGVLIPYVEFLRVLGVLDSEEAKQAYEMYRVLVERLRALRQRNR